MSKEKIRIHGTGSLPQYELDGDDYDRYYLPARAIIRHLCDREAGNKSAAILPGKVLDETVSTLENSLGIKSDHSLEYYHTPDSGYLLWKDINQDIQGFLEWLSSNEQIKLNPYASAEDYWKVYDSLAMIKETSTNMDRIDKSSWLLSDCFAHKGAYYPWISGENSPIGNMSFLQKPKGIVVDDIRLLNQALDIHFTDRPLVVKQIYAGGGYGIDFFDNKEKFLENIDEEAFVFESHPFNSEKIHPLLIQEKVNIKHDDLGEVGVSVQYEGQTLRAFTRTLSDGNGHWSGNIILSNDNIQSTGLDTKTIKNIKDMSQKLLCLINPQGKGGIDFVIDTEGQPQFMEVNGGRTTGAEEATAFVEAFSPKGVVMIRKFAKPVDQRGTADLSQWLHQRGLSLGVSDERRNPSFGILPIVSIGDHVSVLIHAENVLKSVEYAKAIEEYL